MKSFPHPLHLVAVVDDDASVRGALWRLLAAERYQVRTFATAEEFLVSEDAARASCAVVDVHLGEGRMSGLDLAAALAGVGRELPIVLVTARPGAEIARRAGQLGCVALLEKPFDCERLLRAISGALRPPA